MKVMKVGTRIGEPEDVTITASKFNRHTFWCGQSGSGKTYALGVVLEQILLNTELPVLIFDPNADFVRIREIRSDAAAADAAKLEAAQVRVLRSAGSEGDRLRASFLGLSLTAKAAVLQLDPVRDADEYNALLHSYFDPTEYTNESFLESLRSAEAPGALRLATRIENLRVLDWELWARGREAATDVIDSRPRATVLDLGGFSHPEEPKVAALSVLEHLWKNREERRPVLIVIDEAHNLCPPEPTTIVERELTDQIIQIAAEGRKFGLWLLLSTQRPTKIHPNVLSQCDNLCLMRMNSPRDLAELADVFGFVPEEMLNQAQRFGQGQALIAGGFIDAPTLTQMGARLTEEGGSDVAVPLG